ncbi:MAG: MATE family efflux transporter [Planctomycetia bacterium]|nr:MATE family efflux transporter [Planctomycetia bacterium]
MDGIKTEKESKKIRRHNLIKYVVPSVLGSCCFFLYIIVDGVFVGRGVGTDALGAVNLTLPFIMVAFSLITLMTMGGITVVAIRFGRGDIKGANDAFMHSITGTLLITALLGIFGVFFTDELCSLLGTNDTFRQMMKDYIFWYAVFLIPGGIGVMLQGFCRNDNSPILTCISVIAGSAANIFFDWLFIFPMQMGIKGAAIATGVSECLVFAIIISHFLLRKGRLRIRSVPLKYSLFRKIIGRGSPEMIAQFATPITVFCMNSVLIARLGDSAVNAYSIIGYITFFFVAVFFGASEGLQPLFGQSFGAKAKSDLKYYFRAGCLINFLGSILILIIILLAETFICKLFRADPETFQVTLRALPQFIWVFLVLSQNFMISAYLFSTKRTTEAVIMNVCRSLIFNSVLITLLPRVFGNGIIWYTFGISEFLTFLVAFYLLKRSEKKAFVSWDKAS